MVVATAPSVRPAAPSVFTWDGTQYVRAGQLIPVETIRQGVEAVLQASGQRVRALSTRLVSGQGSLAEFQTGMVAELKTLHVATATALGRATAPHAICLPTGLC
jgi:hypothetical protein